MLTLTFPVAPPEAVSVIAGHFQPHLDAPSDEIDSWEDEYANDDGLGTLPATSEAVTVGTIADTINRLYRIATQIRNSSFREISRKAYSYQMLDPDTHVDLLDQFYQFDLSHTWHVLASDNGPSPKASRSRSFEISPILLDRFARANKLRRQNFAYQQRHRHKLEEVSVAQLIGTQDEQPPVPLSIPTTATQIHPVQKLIPIDDIIPAPSSYAPTARGASNEAVEVPPPPHLPEDEKYFECPYCFTLCSADQRRDQVWK